MGTSIFERPTAPLWRGRRCNSGVRAGVFRDQIGMRPQAVAGPFDLDDDSVMQQPIQKCGRDHGIPEDLAPFGKAAILLSALNQCATMTQ